MNEDRTVVDPPVEEPGKKETPAIDPSKQKAPVLEPPGAKEPAAIDPHGAPKVEDPQIHGGD